MKTEKAKQLLGICAMLLGLDPKTTKRIVFHEITKPAITHAIENPRTIDINLS